MYDFESFRFEARDSLGILKSGFCTEKQMRSPRLLYRRFLKRGRKWMARHVRMALAARAELKMTNGSHRTTMPHSSVIMSGRQYRICKSFDRCAIINTSTSK